MAEAELTTVARPYARAVFSRAIDEPSGLGSWSRMLGLMAAAASQAVVKKALDNPVLTTAQESALLCDLLGDELTKEGRNFLVVLGEHGRIPLLPQISELYEHLKAQHEKTMDVTVTSAFEVDEADQTRLEEALKRRLQKDIKLSSSVDPGLLGGVVIRTEDTVIDNSVRGKLAKLARALN
jgi:F-type H+-transporting ATPase subunit delta